MNKRSIAATLTVAMLAFGTIFAEASFAAQPLPKLGSAQFIPTRGPSSGVPAGYYMLCRKAHPVCRTTRGRGVARNGSGAVQLNSATWRQLIDINARINRSMRQVSDSYKNGRADEWTVGGGKGDCEDFALTKKQELLRLGWPSSALLIALARTGSGQSHAVLIARTDNGDLVLDNLNPRVRAFSRQLYRWDMVQSPTQTWVWHRI